MNSNALETRIYLQLYHLEIPKKEYLRIDSLLRKYINTLTQVDFYDINLHSSTIKIIENFIVKGNSCEIHKDKLFKLLTYKYLGVNWCYFYHFDSLIMRYFSSTKFLYHFCYHYATSIYLSNPFPKLSNELTFIIICKYIDSIAQVAINFEKYNCLDSLLSDFIYSIEGYREHNSKIIDGINEILFKHLKKPIHLI